MFGRASVFGVLRETRFGSTSQWTAFPNLQTGLAWSQSTVARWLRKNEAGADRYFAVWHGRTWWSVQIDRRRQRYTVVVGLAPGVLVKCYDSRADMPCEHEPRALTEARGWARVVELLPVGREDWPWGMVSEYDQALAAASALTAGRAEPAAVGQEDQVVEPGPAIAGDRPARWWSRFWAWISGPRTA
ncbi:hypothetical protein [Kitasatospora sp. NPDC088548]|uniref:hypothetical protein n=1 Tax=Kitasatospora sp. NPDC088548 TaxID=3364075 RepID=UPI00382C3BF8